MRYVVRDFSTLRKKAGLTISQVADAIAVSRSSVTRLENGTGVKEEVAFRAVLVLNSTYYKENGEELIAEDLVISVGSRT